MTGFLMMYYVSDFYSCGSGKNSTSSLNNNYINSKMWQVKLLK